MLPIEKLSSIPVPGVAYKSNLSTFKGSVYGGEEYGKFNGFVTVANWVYNYSPTSGQLVVYKEGDPTDEYTILENLFKVSEISFTFDKQMLPIVAYIQEKVCKIYFFDSSLNTYNTIEIPEAVTPKVALNSIRTFHIEDSNVVLGYVKNEKLLCIRLQQDRYSKEIVVKEFANKIKLFNIGYADTNRFQYEVLEAG